MRTLYWIDTLNKDMDEIHKITDTGFCNRIVTWEILQFLNERNGFSFEIKMGESWWPELKEVLQFPNTSLINENINDSRESKIEFIVKNSKRIGIEDLNKMIETNNFNLNDDSYYVDIDFGKVAEIFHSVGLKTKNFKRPIHGIKIKNKELNEFIESTLSECIGIHIRRGRGVKYKDKLNTLPKENIEKYISFHKPFGEATYEYYIYKFIEDAKYFQIIDNILKINPSQKFYISHDLSDELMEYYEKKYPNNIITRKIFYDKINNKYPNTKKNHVMDSIDLISLSNSFITIGSQYSTWSIFAIDYKDKTSFHLSEETLDEDLETWYEIYKRVYQKIIPPNSGK